MITSIVAAKSKWMSPRTAGRKQSSPLVFAIIVAVLGTAGGLFLTNVEEVSHEPP